MVIVKRYGNRRLYDTADSSYVTLTDVAAKIRGGTDVRVVDARTEEDLTQQVLTQIIFEDHDASRLLPVALLEQLIRMGDDSLAEFFSRYVSWALDVYLQARQGIGALHLNPFASTAWNPLNPLAAILGNAGRSERTPALPPSANPAAEELAALRRELDELKRSLRKPRR